MDTFVRRFFKEFDAPGADLVFNPKLSTRAYMRGCLKVSDGDIVQNRFFYSSQPMTLLGKMEAYFGSHISSLDGLSRQYLTPEGGINIMALNDMLKVSSGLQGVNLQTHFGAMMRWNWADNHVSLLLNMLRFCFIRKVCSVTQNLNASLGVYNDGHVSIDMDQFFDHTYPPECDFSDGWPGSLVDTNYPDFERLEGVLPTEDGPVLDLRGLSAVQARFVLLMTAAWQRRSRLRLDFSLDKLADRIRYRSDVAITNLSEFLDEPEPGSAAVPAPELPSFEVCWAAIKIYITQNRLYDQFSTALYMFCSIAYQYEPVTAEGIYWLSIDWKASLPRFNSVRGRYVFLNEGDAALVNHRALNEWGFISGSMEKINLMALLFSQAYMTGLSIRGIRKGLEDAPLDLFNSEADMYNSANLVSAGAAELVRSEVPLSGMPGVYLYTDEPFESYDESRCVITQNTEISERMEGYEVEMIETNVGPRVSIISPYLAMPGFPTLLVPLDPFPYDTPLGLKGRFSNEKLECNRAGTRLKARELWHVAALNRLCGYDVDFKFGGENAGPSEYFAPNDISFCWPVLTAPDDTEQNLTWRGSNQRGNNFIQLPPMHSRFFKGRYIEYNIKVLQRGTSATFAQERRDIEEAGPSLNLMREVTVSYGIPEGIKRLRGYITRDESGFRFVGDVSGGLIPPPEQAPSA